MRVTSCLARAFLSFTYVLKALEKDALDAKRTRWLEFHDQKTGGIMGLLPLIKGLPVRLTQAVNRSLKLFKNTKCTIQGWSLDDNEALFLSLRVHHASQPKLCECNFENSDSVKLRCCCYHCVLCVFVFIIHIVNTKAGLARRPAGAHVAAPAHVHLSEIRARQMANPQRLGHRSLPDDSGEQDVEIARGDEHLRQTQRIPHRPRLQPNCALHTRRFIDVGDRRLLAGGRCAQTVRHAHRIHRSVSREVQEAAPDRAGFFTSIVLPGATARTGDPHEGPTPRDHS